MARRNAKPGRVDVAAAYCDPRAVPLGVAAELLDLIYPDLGEDEIRDQIIAPDLKGGRLRMLGYEHPRRMSDTTVLVPTELVRHAFQYPRDGLVYDPVHDRVVRRSIVSGTPPARRLRERPDMRERLREQQRLAALPPAIDWQGCRIRAGRYVFVNCKVILAKDLARFEITPRAPGAPRGKRRSPKNAIELFDKMIETLGVTDIAAPEAAEVIIKAHREVLYSRPDEVSGAEEIVNPGGWWAYATLVRNISDRQRNKKSW